MPRPTNVVSATRVREATSRQAVAQRQELRASTTDIFQEDLPRMSLDRDIEFIIELVPGTTPMSKRAYRMPANELEELERGRAQHSGTLWQLAERLREWWRPRAGSVRTRRGAVASFGTAARSRGLDVDAAGVHSFCTTGQQCNSNAQTTRCAAPQMQWSPRATNSGGGAMTQARRRAVA